MKESLIPSSAHEHAPEVITSANEFTEERRKRTLAESLFNISFRYVSTGHAFERNAYICDLGIQLYSVVESIRFRWISRVSGAPMNNSVVSEIVSLLLIATRLDTWQFVWNGTSRSMSVGHFAKHHARRNENRYLVENCAATHLGISYQEVRSLDMNALLVFFAHTALV